MRNVISVLSSTSGTPLPGFPLRRLPVAAATPLLLSVEVVPPHKLPHSKNNVRVYLYAVEMDTAEVKVIKLHQQLYFTS